MRELERQVQLNVEAIFRRKSLRGIRGQADMLIQQIEALVNNVKDISDQMDKAYPAEKK